MAAPETVAMPRRQRAKAEAIAMMRRWARGGVVARAASAGHAEVAAAAAAAARAAAAAFAVEVDAVCSMR